LNHLLNELGAIGLTQRNVFHMGWGDYSIWIQNDYLFSSRKVPVYCLLLDRPLVCEGMFYENLSYSEG